MIDADLIHSTDRGLCGYAFPGLLLLYFSDGGDYAPGPGADLCFPLLPLPPKEYNLQERRGRAGIFAAAEF